MRVGPELHCWIRDEAAQREARNRADEVAAQWNDGSVHAAFDEAFARLEDRSAESIAAIVRTLFADDRAVDAAVHRLAEAMRANPFLEPPFRNLNSDIHSGLVLYENAHASIAAGVTSLARLAEKKSGKRGGSIVFSGQVDVFKFVRAANARLALWEAPRIDADFTAATAGSCRQTGEYHLRNGDVLVVDGRMQSFIIEHATANLVVLQATIKADQAPVSIEYDRASGKYLGCSAADDSASRIQMLTTLLRKLDCAAAFPAIAEFLDHPNFFVRWHVMRELLGLDAMAALPHLKLMAAHDPHPETRRAARAVLERLEGPQSPSRKAA